MMNQTIQGQQSGRRVAYAVVVIACLSLGACSWIPKGETGLDVGIKDRGIASWYGAQFHGKLAANGEIFDMSALTAAHRTLPLGSIIRVVNLQNGKHVRVRVNDRGPYVNGRILDLSYAAAAQLGMVDSGLSVIQLEVIGDHRSEFDLPVWDSSTVRPSSLAGLQPAPKENPPLPLPILDLPHPAMTPTHRLAPNDVLLQRRWRWEPSVLAEGPSNQDDPTLVLA